MRQKLSLVISSRQKLQSLNDKTINVYVEGVKLNQTDHSKALGLNIGENLSWKEHIHAIWKKIASSIGALKRVRPFISLHTAIKMYKGLIEPHLTTVVLFGMACHNSWVRNYKNYKISLLEKLLNQVILRTLAIFSALSAGITSQLEGQSKFNVQMR